jgi:glycosyltransferase involved in cell wall biosynthesis
VKTSLILTVLNEAQSLPVLLDSIAAQTQLPDEVVICDGGSKDATLHLLRAERRFPVQVIEAPGATISRGRNRAIEAAKHDVIACTDAGTRLHPEWLARLTLPFERGYSVNVVSGFFLADFDTPFELAMSATVLPAREDVKGESFLPSSRSVAFRKSAWKAVEGYPEWLDYCEDLIFDLALRDRFGAFIFAPDAVAYFRPRGTLRAFFKQYFLYARGDGKAGLWLKRHVIRYVTYLLAFPVLLAGVVLAPTLWAWGCGVALVIGAAGYLHAPYRRLFALWRGWSAPEKLLAALWVPVIRLTGDIAKMAGYPVGVIWRLRRK